MFVKLIKAIKGYVVFSVIVPDSGAFLAEASYTGKIYSIREEDGIMKISCSSPTYRKLSAVVKKYGGRRKILDKKGLPFLLHKNRKRKGLIIGFAAMLLMIFILTRFVWSVSVEGGTDELRTKLYSVLPDYGIKTGVFKSSINQREMGNALLADYPELSFISLNIVGNRVIVEIDNTDPKPDIPKRFDYGNIIAEKDGKIVTMEVYNGSPTVIEGDNVFAGELLVSGTKEDYFGRTIYMNSSAKITAETVISFDIKLPVNETVAIRTGKHIAKRYFTLFNINIPLHFHFFTDENYETEVKGKALSILGVNLPLSFTKIDMYKVNYKSVNHSEESLRQRAKEIFESEKNELLADKELVSEDIIETVTEEFFTLTVKLTVKEDIAKYVGFEVES